MKKRLIEVESCIKQFYLLHLKKGVRAKIIIKKIEIIENHFHSGFSIEGISNFL